MAEISWTREAERWLRDIYEYIALDNSTAAAEVVNGIFESVQKLGEFPELGYRYRDAQDQMRILLYGHFRIAYLIKPDGSIDILGVFHGALDIDRYLV